MGVCQGAQAQHRCQRQGRAPGRQQPESSGPEHPDTQTTPTTALPAPRGEARNEAHFSDPWAHTHGSWRSPPARVLPWESPFKAAAQAFVFPGSSQPCSRTQHVGTRGLWQPDRATAHPSTTAHCLGPSRSHFISDLGFLICKMGLTRLPSCRGGENEMRS